MGSKEGESRFVERIGLSTEPKRDLVTEIDDLLLPGTSSVADPGFSGFPPTEFCVEAVMRLFARTCVYI